MASFEQFVLKVKPALDIFLRAPSPENLERLRNELQHFNFRQMKVFHAQILAPLVLKLEELNGANQDLMAGILDCVRIVMSKLYLEDVQELRTLLVIVLKQIRESGAITTRPNLSEELKLISVQCIAEALRRSNSDVLEVFYTQTSAMLLGQILLSLVEFIEKEKYRKLVIGSLECLMTVFYVHDEAEFTDVVLRYQVADTIFIFLPKIVTVLLKTSLADEKLGDTLKSAAIKALGRVLCIIFDQSNNAAIKCTYDKNDFKTLIGNIKQYKGDSLESDADIFGNKKSQDHIEERLKRMQGNGRSKQWFKATSKKLRTIYVQTNILRSHESVRVRTEYARMCCTLIDSCAHNLEENFLLLLESVIAMTEDRDMNINKMCQRTLNQLQHLGNANECIFDDYAETLFDEHIAKLPRVINRGVDVEQYAELIFLKGFLTNLSTARLHCLFLVPKNLEMLCHCLLAAVDMKMTRDLLTAEYAIREIVEADYVECAKLNWRQYKYLNSERCVNLVKDICGILGNSKGVNRLIYDFLFELLVQKNEAMNEILLLLLWVGTAADIKGNKSLDMELVELLIEEILNDKHWYLALQPDASWRLKVDKPTDWFVDRTPGLYESAVEIRTQDVDLDDERDVADASNNTMVYQAASFCLVSIQKALKFAEVSHLIETHTDYISYHLNTILKRTPESSSAVDILTVVLQLSSRRALPHLETIFQTIQEECSKSQQNENINAFLRAFHAFLKHITQWQNSSDADVTAVPMQIIDDAIQNDDHLKNWLQILESSNSFIEDGDVNVDNENIKYTEIAENSSADVDMIDESADVKPQLPRHIDMVKNILNQTLKFVSFRENSQQILALECLICGLPLLRNYEDELLPLVHLIWSPLVEKFRNGDVIVLNRCFTLMNILATYAKDFILKRSLDDVIPYLKNFLIKSAHHSRTEKITAQTQEHKLQVILLKSFANLIESIQIDGKHLNEIVESVSLYLAKEQPKDLQALAVQFYESLYSYNGPLAYMTLVKRAHIINYKDNVDKVFRNWLK
ncbi:TELO2-interacting protein 1 homolog isoform X2 [Eurosta solidaginis]|uniref:TELO2-interacting protein 1 homolog isoform X2 n=1 Tax=Eurosta solidaginis TaxID=178769 RepID=UPI003530BCBC